MHLDEWKGGEEIKSGKWAWTVRRFARVRRASGARFLVDCNVLLYTKVDPLEVQSHARCKFFLFAWKDHHLIYSSNQPVIKLTVLSFFLNRWICLIALRESTPRAARRACAV